MANYTAADVKALRDKTGVGMMDVKKALDEAQGDAAKAEEILRIHGAKAAAKREGRTAANGLVTSKVIDTEAGQRGVLIEVNSETDFVAKTDRFIKMAEEILEVAIDSKATTVEELLAAKLAEGTVADRVTEEIAVIGEKLEVSNLEVLEGEVVDAYMHRTDPDLPPQVGVLVATDEAGRDIAHDVAVHIAALNPKYLNIEDVPADVVETEKRIATETTIAEGKPEKAVPKIVEGRMHGFYKQVVLLEQGWAREPKKSVKQVIAEHGGKVTGFKRVRVGDSATEEA
ncbi:elongation factor Ts [Actinobaculum suis]|uniref:Elongation factor Ts n=1 Tax=Actinobaculum suis TaxID=1657 RepID=A0A0K9EVY1_9ACTO|nr:translation elongation factor Ts [Actinobaculum suis]KMY24042.1 elongation factor Ts [Actinobaculum suis]MDY5154033.1 translation elongation factor Ts [Actinobaculum suis]OCA95651.1 translation elongation factor Ts [Actinobaculum suis]OCA95851.1 translation elongation factor Ts [Actinobaculum suis]SDE02121.1 elongation factor Ts [Actinobaculum suis]